MVGTIISLPSSGSKHLTANCNAALQLIKGVILFFFVLLFISFLNKSKYLPLFVIHLDLIQFLRVITSLPKKKGL